MIKNILLKLDAEFNDYGSKLFEKFQPFEKEILGRFLFNYALLNLQRSRDIQSIDVGLYEYIHVLFNSKFNIM